VEICLEVGAGSGVVSAFLASMIGPQTLYMCTDINPQAAACTLETARCNRVHIQPVITDLVQGLMPRLKGKVDLLVFNPPYVVTPPEEILGGSRADRKPFNNTPNLHMPTHVHMRATHDIITYTGVKMRERMWNNPAF
ncbi:hypothetical protein STEG23_019298, partial [Scotinomys teguina]